jgi:predicted phosphate transport protein (TIGR00153 family)
MTFRLLPKDGRFFELFTSDGENLHAAARGLRSLVAEFDRLDERVAEIQALEKRGDELDREISRRLDDAFVTPFDREDIHDLVSRLDDVVDGIQAVAETFVIYDVSQPTQEARRLTEILEEQSGALLIALRGLERLKGLDEPLASVHELEHEADGLSRSAVARLFRETVDAVEVVKWRDIYRVLEETIDAAEDAAEAIERMYHKTA